MTEHGHSESLPPRRRAVHQLALYLPSWGPPESLAVLQVPSLPSAFAGRLKPQFVVRRQGLLGWRDGLEVSDARREILLHVRT